MQVSQTSLSTVLGSRDRELPVLKQLGFKQPLSSSSADRKLRRHQSSNTSSDNRPSSDPKPHSTKSHNSSNNNSNNNSNSNSSSSSSSSSNNSNIDMALCSPPKGNSPLHSKIHSESSSSTCSVSDKIQADQLTSFLSRIKYLYEETENSEAIPISIPAGSSYSDQRSLIKAQAQIIRNQLDLKFSSISFLSQLDKFNEKSYVVESTGGKYNPLQVIRDREKRMGSSKQPHRFNIWQIPVSEQIQDIRWRFRTARTKAHKQRRKQRKSSSTKEQDFKDRLFESLSNERRAWDESHENNSSTFAENKSGRSRNGSVGPYSDGYDSRPQFNNPFFASNGGMGSTEGPKLSLPKTESNELIHRLRTKHSVYVDERNESIDSLAMPDGGGAESSGASRKSFSAEECAADDSSWAKSRFCRNTACVADTWNRMYRARTNSSNSQLDDNNLKPLTKITTNSGTSQSGVSISSSAVVDGDDMVTSHLEVPMPLHTLKTSNSSKTDIYANESENLDEVRDSLSPPSSSIALRLHSRAGSSSELPPLLTVTTNNGKQSILDDPISKTNSNTTTSTAAGENEVGSRPRSIRMRRKDSHSSDVTDIHDMDDTFGSFRTSTADVRKNPYERKLCDLENELRFLILFYKVALRREEPEAIRIRSQLKIEACHTKNGEHLGDMLKNELITKFLTYLSKVEHSVVSDQQLLDADIATTLDGLRVTTDLIASEVNTTLNRRIREVTSRMERLYSFRDGGYFIMLLYSILEYVLLCAMRVIWCGVKIWKVFSLMFVAVKAFCNFLIVA